MRVLLIKDDVVVNAIFADSVERAVATHPGHEAIEQPDGVGPGFRRVDGVWVAPEPVIIQEPKIITRLAFLNRFTDEEAISIDLLSIGATVQAAAMRRYMQKVNAATFIDLDSPETRGGVMQLEAIGVLAQGRALQILDSPVQQNEKPSGGF